LSDPQSEIVGQVVHGERLVGTGKRANGMVEIEPPAEVVGWVHGELVRDGRIVASSVRVRSGPGIGYRSIGKVSKGFNVNVREQVGDWVRIAPPASCRVWISADYVAREAEPAADTGADAGSSTVDELKKLIDDGAEKPVVKVHEATPIEPVEVAGHAEKTPENPVEVVKTPAVLSAEAEPVKPKFGKEPESELVVSWKPKQVDIPVEKFAAGADLSPRSKKMQALEVEMVKRLQLTDGVPQGRPVVVSGIVRLAPYFPLRRPSSYRLVVTDPRQRAKTGCYLIGDQKRIAALSGKPVRVVGKKYWGKGVREPVVLVSLLCRP
jgi:hypothetical protein